MAAFLDEILIWPLGVDAHHRILAAYTVTAHDTVDSDLAVGDDADGCGAALGKAAGKQLYRVYRGKRTAGHGKLTQPVLKLHADILMQGFLVGEHHRAERLAVELPVNDRACEILLYLVEHRPVGLKHPVIHGIAVYQQCAAALKLVERSGLAAACAARDADYLHTIDKRVGYLIRRKRALTQDPVRCAAEVYQRRFTPDAAFSAVKHGVDLAVEIFQNAVGVFGAWLAGRVRRRGCKGYAAFFEQLQRQRVIRAAQADRLPSRADYLRHTRRGFHHYRQRPRPELFRECIRLRRDIFAVALHRRRVMHHERQGLDLRPPLDLVYFRHGFLVKTVPREAVHSLRRDGYESAAAHYSDKLVGAAYISLCVHVTPPTVPAASPPDPL